MHVEDSFSETKRKLLEVYLSAELGSVRALPSKIAPRPAGTPAPLSLAQEQLWTREQILGGCPLLYNESVTIRASSSLDAAILERSLLEIVRRHEIWRTTYDTPNGEPVQIVHPAPARFPLQVVDLRSIPEPERETKWMELTAGAARQPFGLKRGPLLRATLVRLADTDHRLFISAHLSIIDGVSVYQILPFELSVLYEAFSSGKGSPLPELPIQYADYSYWQRQWLKDEELAKQVSYWREQLAGPLPVLQWPTEHPRPSVQTHSGVTQPFAVNWSLAESLKDASRGEKVTLFTILLASLGVLLHGYTRQTDLVIGTPSPAGRKRSEVQPLLGYFLNPVALRLNLEGDPPFRELLQRVRKVLAGAISYDDVPIELLAKKLRLERDPSRSPLFTVAISLQPQTPTMAAGWSVTSMDAESGGSVWDMYLAFIETADGMVGRVQYNPDLFAPATITQMLQDLHRLMEVLTVDPGRPISSGFTIECRGGKRNDVQTPNDQG